MDKIRIAAVQAGVDHRWSPGEWLNHLRWQLAACREARADLAVFPAWTGVYQESFPRGFPEEALGTLLRLLGDLALEARLYLVPGSIPVRCPDGVRLRSLILAPSGDLLGSQDQLCPPAGYAAGEALHVFPSALGQLAILNGPDAFVPEFARILALMGADLICIPQALPLPYQPWRQAALHHLVAEANQIAAVEACLVGEFYGQMYQGRSRVMLPAAATADGSGTINAAASVSATEVVVAELDPSGIDRARAELPLFDAFNLGLYQNLMPAAYERFTAAPADQSVPPQESGSEVHQP